MGRMGTSAVVGTTAASAPRAAIEIFMMPGYYQLDEQSDTASLKCQHQKSLGYEWT
jgi:hypothetical protein